MRAAVSRAYYAAFHHPRAIAEERVGLPRFGAGNDHRDIELALVLLDTDTAREFAVVRNERNDADYGFSDAFGRSRATNAVRLSVTLVAWD